MSGRFAKGHPYLPPKDGTAPLGVSKDTRRRLRNLAMVIRENMPPEEIFRWLRDVMAGRDPDRPPPKEGEADLGGLTPIEWPVRMRAAKMLLERALGQPAQHVHLEAELKGLMGTVAIGTPGGSEGLKGASNEALDVLRQALRQLVPGQKGPIAAQSRDVGVAAPVPALPAPRATSSGGSDDGGYGSSRDKDDEPEDDDA